MKTENEPTSSAARIHLVWGCVFIAFACTGLLAYKITLDKAQAAASRLVDEAKAAAAAAVAAAESVAEKFKTGTITETFRAEIPVFKSAGIGLLEVGTAEAIETFSKSETLRIAWDWIYLGETVTEIKVSVTYRYHLDLAGDWDITVTDGNCIVRAPKLHPSLPVAIHTDKLEKKTSKGWSTFDASAQMEELQKSITPKLNTNAAKPEHLDNVREEARVTVARFIRAWLVREKQWMEGKLTTVTVIFPDESVSTRPSTPTVTFNDLQ